MQLSGDPLQYLEKTLTMLEDKIMRLGVGLQEYYCVCAIIGLIKQPPDSLEQSRNEQIRSADRVTAMIQRVLTAQDNYSAAATLASLPNMVYAILSLFFSLTTNSELTIPPIHPARHSCKWYTKRKQRQFTTSTSFRFAPFPPRSTCFTTPLKPTTTAAADDNRWDRGVA